MANSTLGFIYRNLRRCPPACRNTSYPALVRPLPEYGVAMWGPLPEKDIALMERTQRNAARFITGYYRSTTAGSVTRLLRKTDLQPLQEHCLLLRLTPLYGG